MNKSHIDFLSSPGWAQMLRTDLLPWIEAAGDLGDDVLEIGPGPGLTTDLLAERVARLTAVEVDPALADPLRERLVDTGVEVICADATESGLESDRFSAVTCFSVLHHMPSPEYQDRLFAEVGRVLRPGGIFVGQDALDLDLIRAGHEGDTFVPVDPDGFPKRLSAGGLGDTNIEVADFHFLFLGRKPLRSTRR
ncbi:MAG: class I SAM-dependent methyltransferase [Acidimicrobiales bacterium]